MRKFPRYKQGEFNPSNREKYCGKWPLFFRSSWELKVCMWLDRTPAVKKWGIESAIVPYLDPVTKRQKRYVIDFTALIEDKDGALRKYYIEVKPHKETIRPEKGRKSDRKFLVEALTFARNSAKWQAASAFAGSKGAQFILLTEMELGT